MSFRSTLSTFCFQIIIALLVQQRIFVCASECFCQCNQQLVCDELNRLATSDAANVGQWTRWNTYLMYLKTLHRDFDPEVWSEKIISVENKAESIEGLKEKLTDTEFHVTRLEAALENVRKEFEEKMADFAQKMLNVQNQAMTLERNVNKAEKKITATQIQIVNIEKRVDFVENQTNSFEQAIKAEENINEQFGTEIINIERRVGFVENQTNSFERTVEEEEKPRKQLAMYISTLEKEMQLVKNQIKQFENVTEAEKEAIEQLDVKISTIEEKMNTTENEIKSIKPDIELEKRARQHLVASAEIQNKVLQEDFQEELHTVKEEINTLKSDIDRGRKVRNSFQDELLRNTSKRFFEVEKQYEKLKDDYDTKLLNIDKYTKLLQWSIEEEKTARNIYEVKVENNLSTTHVKLAQIWNELQKFTEIAKLMQEAHIVTSAALQVINEEVAVIKARLMDMAMRSRGRRALKRSVNEIRKGPSRTETEAIHQNSKLKDRVNF